MAFEEYGQGFDLVDAVFGGGGQMGVDGGELGRAGQGAPGAALGPLVDLDRSDLARVRRGCW